MHYRPVLILKQASIYVVRQTPDVCYGYQSASDPDEATEDLIMWVFKLVDVHSSPYSSTATDRRRGRSSFLCCFLVAVSFVSLERAAPARKVCVQVGTRKLRIPIPTHGGDPSTTHRRRAIGQCASTVGPPEDTMHAGGKALN
jgi:hypothetical protein